MLSRCKTWSSDEDIYTLLEQRYSTTGSQKPYLILEGTDQGGLEAETKSKTPSGLEGPSLKNKYDPLRVKNQFKNKIKSQMKTQDTIARKLRMISKRNPQILMQDVIQLRLCKPLMRYEDYISMNELWSSYISELISDSNNIQLVTAKLSSAEYIGAKLTVTHSLNPEQIGMKGIVLWESKDYYLIIVPRKSGWKSEIPDQSKVKYSAMECIGGLRKIQKVHTRFQFDVNSGDDQVVSFEIIGDRMNIRSVDRANKKFKGHSVDDLNI